MAVQLSNLMNPVTFYHDINQFVTSVLLEMAQNLFIFGFLNRADESF